MRLKNEMDQAARHFVEMMRGLGWSEHTVRAYERGVMFFSRWLVKSTTIESMSEITSETIEAWRVELCGWKISQATCDLRFAAVRTFVRMMKQSGVIEDDVAAYVAFPKKDPRKRGCDRPRERPVPDAEEIDLAVASIGRRAAIDLRDRAILKVLLMTGLRNSELRALTIEDADFVDRTLLVRNGKGRKMRIVPMGRAASALEWYVREARPKLGGPLAGGALFLSREKRPLSRKALEGIVRRRLGVSPHRLRHSCATSMIRGGVREEKVQALLGHASCETTRIYVH